MQKTRLILTALCLPFTAQASEQFVSLTLCSDRLLIELAEPSQIAAQSPYSKKPLMMLDKINTDKPVLQPQLTELLPYLDKTILINETFYPQLVAELKKLNVVTKLKSQNFHLNRPLTDTLILSETGVVESYYPQYPVLLNLLGLTPLKTPLTAQNFSLEKVILSQPNVLISLTDKQGYNAQAELLHHPMLQDFFKNQPLVSIPMKYTYCFDHGVWQGAEKIYEQLK
ncbi:MAG: helical backbone metal receptor [Haemophilus parainfluenzae]|nr:helical backbone metal receptor [Haemophilus parainfluenzae]